MVFLRFHCQGGLFLWQSKSIDFSSIFRNDKVSTLEDIDLWVSFSISCEILPCSVVEFAALKYGADADRPSGRRDLAQK